jgi:hypothetical protein
VHAVQFEEVTRASEKQELLLLLPLLLFISCLPSNSTPASTATKSSRMKLVFMFFVPVPMTEQLF